VNQRGKKKGGFKMKGSSHIGFSHYSKGRGPELGFVNRRKTEGKGKGGGGYGRRFRKVTVSPLKKKYSFFCNGTIPKKGVQFLVSKKKRNGRGERERNQGQNRRKRQVALTQTCRGQEKFNLFAIDQKDQDETREK